jgi:hypothetical protein
MSASSVSTTPRGRTALIGLCLVVLGLLLLPTGLAVAAGPDVTPPTGSIGRPPSAQAGKSVTFTANVQDEPGGSGIDPNGFVWESAGFPTKGGATTSYVFAAAGTYEVKLTYHDLAGNASSVTIKVPVIADQSVLPPAGIDVPKARIAATADKKSVVVSISGSIEPVLGAKAVTGEPLLISTVCRSSVALSVRRGTTSIASATADLVRRTCAYRRTLTIDRKKLGTATTLSLVVRFNANAAMRKTTESFVVPIPKLPAIPKDKKKKKS